MSVYQDAGEYFGIAQDGYEVRSFDATRVANWAFFPLHPMIWRALVPLFGNSPLVGVILANIYFLIALVVLHRTCLALDYESLTADRALLAIAFFPTSYFFCLPWTESLFLLVTCSTIYAALRHRWALAAVLGTAACACRLAGIFLVCALVIWAWENRKTLPRLAWVAIAVMPLGLILFMAMLHSDTGNALAFLDIQSVWGRHFELPIRALGVVLIKPLILASDGNLRHWNFLVFFAALYAAYWFAFRRNQLWLATFLLLGTIVPTLTGSIASESRYVMALFPFSIAIGQSMRNVNVERVVLIVFPALLVLSAVALQAHLSFASV